MYYGDLLIYFSVVHQDENLNAINALINSMTPKREQENFVTQKIIPKFFMTPKISLNNFVTPKNTVKNFVTPTIWTSPLGQV